MHVVSARLRQTEVYVQTPPKNCAYTERRAQNQSPSGDTNFLHKIPVQAPTAITFKVFIICTARFVSWAPYFLNSENLKIAKPIITANGNRNTNFFQ
jgi:hypothetical protein